MKVNISVLMSVYFRETANNLKEALDSVFSQTYPPSEVILVKDGPLTVELDDLIARYEKIYTTLKVVSLEVNVGLGRALNEGMKHCSNELVARMDSDDICKPNRFECQIKVFECDPTLAIVGSWLDEFLGSIENIVSIKKLPETNIELSKYCKRRSPINHPTVMFKKSIIDSVGGYKDFYLFEDYYLWARVVHAGYKMYNIQESLLYFRSNPNMIARRGGWKYAVSEMKLEYEFLNMKFISLPEFCGNLLIRFIVRICPNKLRIFIYSKLLR